MRFFRIEVKLDGHKGRNFFEQTCLENIPCMFSRVFNEKNAEFPVFFDRNICEDELSWNILIHVKLIPEVTRIGSWFAAKISEF